MSFREGSARSGLHSEGGTARLTGGRPLDWKVCMCVCVSCVSSVLTRKKGVFVNLIKKRIREMEGVKRN